MTVKSGMFSVAMGAMALMLMIFPAQAGTQTSTSSQASQSQQQKQQNQQKQQQRQRVQAQPQQHQVNSQGNRALNQLKDIAGQGPRVNDHRYHGELYDTPGPERSKNSIMHPQVKPAANPPTPPRPTAIKDDNYARTGNPVYKSLKPSKVPPPKTN
jgi:hypothetical protein